MTAHLFLLPWSDGRVHRRSGAARAPRTLADLTSPMLLSTPIPTERGLEDGAHGERSRTTSQAPEASSSAATYFSREQRPEEAHLGDRASRSPRRPRIRRRYPLERSTGRETLERRGRCGKV
jgi:hypothetical protein